MTQCHDVYTEPAGLEILSDAGSTIQVPTGAQCHDIPNDPSDELATEEPRAELHTSAIEVAPSREIEVAPSTALVAV